MLTPFGGDVKDNLIFYTRKQLFDYAEDGLSLLEEVQETEDEMLYNEYMDRIATILEPKELEFIVKLFNLGYKNELKQIPRFFFVKHEILGLLLRGMRKLGVNKFFVLSDNVFKHKEII